MMRLPWSLQMYQKYGVHLSLGSFLRLRSALIAERAGRIGFHDELALRLRSPDKFDIALRPVSNDMYTFDEIFVDQIYGSLIGLVRDVRTVIDLGANIGLASVYLASKFPRCRIFAVEPDRDNFALLTKNLAAPALVGRTRCVRAAYWPQDTIVAFIPPEQEGHVNQGVVAALAPNESHALPQNVVPGRAMPSLIRESGFDWIDLLKVDIEGAERGLFNEDPVWLDRVGCLAIEFHGNARDESGFDDVMRRFGFGIREGSHHTIIGVRP